MCFVFVQSSRSIENIRGQLVSDTVVKPLSFITKHILFQYLIVLHLNDRKEN